MDPDGAVRTPRNNVHKALRALLVHMHEIWTGGCTTNVLPSYWHDPDQDEMIAWPVYLDEIIVFSSSFEENKYHIRVQFRKLIKAASVALHLCKSEFFYTEEECLGYVITQAP